MPELPEILQALKLAPGETLIVRVSPDRHLTEEQFAHMADRLREAFDDRGMSDRNVVLIAADEIAVATSPAPAPADRSESRLVRRFQDAGPAARLSAPAPISTELYRGGDDV